MDMGVAEIKFPAVGVYEFLFGIAEKGQAFFSDRSPGIDSLFPCHFPVVSDDIDEGLDPSLQSSICHMTIEFEHEKSFLPIVSRTYPTRKESGPHEKLVI